MDKRINDFLDRIEEQIYTQHEAEAIRLEMTDHILSIKEDYFDAGYSEDESIQKSLLQMGDPKQIGYSFTDESYIKKRRLLFLGTRIAAALILIVTFLAMSGFSLSFLQATESHAFILYLLTITFMIITFINGHRLNYLDISSMPLLILWPTKRRFYWEIVFLVAFFVPLLGLMMFIHFYETSFDFTAIVSLWPIIPLILSILMFIQSSKLRFPKHLVLEDGIVINNRLHTWASIESYTWSKEFMSKKADYYKLTLKQFQAGTEVSFNREIHINQHQHVHLQRILKDKLLCQ